MHRHLLVASLFAGTVAVAAVTARSPVGGPEPAAGVARKWGKPHVAARIEQR